MTGRVPKDNRPSNDFPGLRVRGGTPWSTSQGDYVCRSCGAENHATGDHDVTALVADYTANHGRAHQQGNSA
jgi:rubredoxin